MSSCVKGLSLLDVMLDVVNSSSLQLDETFQQWIVLLLSLTEDVRVLSLRMKCVREFLGLSEQYSVTRIYRDYVSYEFYYRFE